MDEKGSSQVVSWGHGVILEKGREVGKIRFETHGLTPEQQTEYEKLKNDHSQAPS